MKREVKFIRGYNCRDFKCVHDSPNCYPGSGGYHGIHVLPIAFYVKDVEGAVQFTLSTNWIPFPDNEGRFSSHDWNFPMSDMYPMPTDLGYHSRKPFYENQYKTENCEVLDGDTCYYDGSGLNASKPFSVLVNAGEEALWEYLENYYLYVFRDGEFPKMSFYDKEER